MNEKYADPSPFAFGAFAFTWWMYCMIPAGWFPQSDLAVSVIFAFTLAGVGILLCAIMEFLRGDTFRTVMFLIFGTAWWSYAVQMKWFSAKLSNGVNGFFWLGWAVLVFFLWLTVFSQKNALLQFFLLGLWITFVLWAIAAWWVPVLMLVGGYVGLITAILGFLLFITELRSSSGGMAKASGGGSTA